MTVVVRVPMVMGMFVRMRYAVVLVGMEVHPVVGVFMGVDRPIVFVRVKMLTIIGLIFFVMMIVMMGIMPVIRKKIMFGSLLISVMYFEIF